VLQLPLEAQAMQLEMFSLLLLQPPALAHLHKSWSQPLLPELSPQLPLSPTSLAQPSLEVTSLNLPTLLPKPVQLELELTLPLI
jgi:hypothetical protein